MGSIPIQYLAEYTQMGQDFSSSIPYWAFLFSRYVNGTSNIFWVGEKHPKRGDFAHLFGRCMLDFIVNGYFFTFILVSLPLQLNDAETGLDFVKDVFAVIFVISLDDINVGSVAFFLSEEE